MDTPMGPQYANIFMTDLEERILEKSTQKPILYLRYIDNIFMLWIHGETGSRQLTLNKLTGDNWF